MWNEIEESVKKKTWENRLIVEKASKKLKKELLRKFICEAWQDLSDNKEKIKRYAQGVGPESFYKCSQQMWPSDFRAIIEALRLFTTTQIIF